MHGRHDHRRRLRGQPGHVPPNNWESPMHLLLFTTFPPNILVCPPNIFDKSTPVVMAGHYVRRELYLTQPEILSTLLFGRILPSSSQTSGHRTVLISSQSINAIWGALQESLPSAKI